jgi:hypothetical protein
MEKKHRYRSGGGEVTEVPVPKGYWDVRESDPAGAAEILAEAANKAGHQGKKFGIKKNDAGQWRISTFGERVENDCIADVYNTCLKMAAKRALVSAVLTVTGASAVFTQDAKVKDMTGNIIDVDYEDMSPNSNMDSKVEPEPEPEPDQEALFGELVAKAGLTTKKEKAALAKFVDITAQAQRKHQVSIIQSALGKHFGSFAEAFAKWFKANESKPKADTSVQEKPAESSEAKDAPTADDGQDKEPTITHETLSAVQKELSRLGAPGQMPPDLVAKYDTGDPSELTETQGQEALEYLKAF